ncbi:ribonuclease H [Senna tora]|uniref:Ribonuclease H n=1 Tax=Senna tora TaxID=362788 RepID=A0A834SY94_9FABA|nr:ribonuclease H [Senna tora]
MMNGGYEDENEGNNSDNDVEPILTIEPWMLQGLEGPDDDDIFAKKIQRVALDGEEHIYFNSADASNILGVPLTMRNIDDKLIWPHTKHNHFSVKTAYHFITVQDSVSGVTTSSTPAFWQKIWRLKLPQHIKNFFWRLCHGILPTRDNLVRRGLSVITDCPRCFTSQESICHIMLGCSWAQMIWLISPLGYFPPLSSDAAFFDWLVDRIMCDSPDVVIWIALICWTIWTGRNALIFQDKMYSPQESVLKAQSLFMEIQDSSTSPGCTQSHSLRIPRSREAYRWQCPSRHHYKMNTDVAKISDVEWSIGVVIRSDQGHLFMTGIKTILALDEVAVAEALGIRWGLQIAQQCHVSKLKVETDCEVVVNSFNAASATDLSLVSDIMADCRSIGAELESFSLRHIYRESNHVAHFVAKQLYHFAPCIWFDAFPISVLNLVNSDVLT